MTSIGVYLMYNSYGGFKWLEQVFYARSLEIRLLWSVSFVVRPCPQIPIHGQFFVHGALPDSRAHRQRLTNFPRGRLV
jgi:hypothetical protein